MSKAPTAKKITPSSGSLNPNRLQTVTLSAAYNIILQISLRVVTFISNAFILRYISQDVLGLINVRLLLLYTTIQFTSREAFRRSCAPKSVDSKETTRWSEVVNVTYLTVPFSVIVGLFFCTVWYHLEQPEEKYVLHYWYGMVSIFSSVVIEQLAESCFIYGQRNDYIRLKVVIEGIFQLVRCLTISSTVALSPENAIFGFAIAQFLASTIYSASYFIYFIFIDGQSMRKFLPSFGRQSLNTTLFQTTLSFIQNTALKQFLTEGERYVMTFYPVITLAEQGVYDTINNLGSLPARLIFQQIEENSYLLFSSIVKRELPIEKQKSEIRESLDICAKLVRFMFLFSLLLFVYGFNCAQLALYLYGGGNFVSGSYGALAVQLLQWHCFYIVFIALNGILESYSFAAMSTQAMRAFNFKMLALSGAFLVVSLQTTASFGSQGFIIANCLNMALRIVISGRFIGQLANSTLSFARQCLPDLVTLLSFLFVFLVLRSTRIFLLSELLFRKSFATVLQQSAIFVLSVGALFVCQLIFIVYRERDLVNFIRTQILRRRAGEEKAKKL